MNKKIGIAAVASFWMLYTYAMDDQPLLNQSLVNLVQQLDYARSRANEASRCYEDEMRRDFEETKQQFMQLVGQKQSAIEWPQVDSNQVPDTIHLKNKHLQVLYRVDNNSLKTVFATMPYAMHGIKKIDVSGNQLDHAPLVDITDVLPNLEECIMSNNNIEYVLLFQKKDKQQHVNLKSIDLSHNKLKKCNMALLLLAYPNLTSINVAHNPLQYITWNFNKVIAPSPSLIIDCQKTNLSVHQKEALVDVYTRQIQAPIKNKIAFMAGLGSGYLALGTVTVMELTIEDNNQKINAVSVASGIGGILGGSLAALGMYWCYRPELQKLEQQAKDNVLFTDEYELQDIQ